MTQNQNVDKVSVIYYDKKNRPKYLELPISLFRSLIYILPTLSIVSIAVVIAGVLYFKQIKEIARRSESQEIIDLRQKNDELIAKEKEISDLNNQLQEKLAQKGVQDSSALQGLGFFKPTPGQIDYSTTPPASVQEVVFEESDTELTLKFKIQNDNQDQKKLVGYVFVIHQAEGQFNIFPKESYKDGQLIASYNQGELFGVTRFRPTMVKFPKIKGQNLFRVIIFSPTGDVLLKNIFKHEI